jgi:hypothetical protein
VPRSSTEACPASVCLHESPAGSKSLNRHTALHAVGASVPERFAHACRQAPGEPGHGISGIQAYDWHFFQLGLWIPATSYPARCAGDAPGESRGNDGVAQTGASLAGEGRQVHRAARGL